MRRLFFKLFILFVPCFLQAQNSLPDSCKLTFGTNLGGLSDYATELPFVDLMHNCREWYTKDVDNPNAGFNSEKSRFLKYRADGYPTHVPQKIDSSNFKQKVVTIWAVTTAWRSGVYTVLYDGKGAISFGGGASDVQQINANKITINIASPIGNYLEMLIDSSLISDPVRNIRVLMPGTETTYQTKPFNPIWIEKLKIFRSVRFMDWASTNHWGQSDPYNWEGTSLFSWAERQQMSNYTWSNSKGVPYEMMLKLMNDYDLDGWVCVPHRASNQYIQEMSKMFHKGVKPNLKLTVEYSNELWNWIFGQANWLYKYGCQDKNVPWPEGLVPYIQNCLDIWTTEYGSDIKRINRAVGLQTGWGDVSRRIVYNMKPKSFDAIAPAYYFGLGAKADSTLDVLGANAKASDIAFWARKTWQTDEKPWMNEIKKTIADSLNVPMLFYEGGQHLTPTPFGEEPTYAKALEDIQRDTAIYNLYQEWFTYVRTLQKGNQPLQLMNFSFVSERSARYGSWGILETMDQDLNVTPAPKYRAILENIKKGCNKKVATEDNQGNIQVTYYPNPANNYFNIETSNSSILNIELTSIDGKITVQKTVNAASYRFDTSALAKGLYIVNVLYETQEKRYYRVVIQ